ncbi:MAG: FK506 binding protein proline rotamase rapamycin-binding protein [Phylliscum demangeonii]|nr:MAG: FK506 binding protein proline rotamase rapamycin-binding protein [Phylliscum demangeonii]
MGVTKHVLREGNHSDRPRKGDSVTIEYTGYLYDGAKDNKKGKQFDSSVGRGDFVTKIGEGQVIKGWDEGVMDMLLGEKSTLTISSGFPGQIPPNSSLVLYVVVRFRFRSKGAARKGSISLTGRQRRRAQSDQRKAGRMRRGRYIQGR